MDESKVIEWVDLNLEKEMYRFALQDWRISAGVGMPHEGMVGACAAVQGTRQRADIYIDPPFIADEDGLKEAIQHELLHCAVGPLETLQHQIHSMLGDDQVETANVLFDTANEAIVRQLERLVKRVAELAIDEYEQEIEDGKGDVDCEAGNPRKRDKKRKRR